MCSCGVLLHSMCNNVLMWLCPTQKVIWLACFLMMNHWLHLSVKLSCHISCTRSELNFTFLEIHAQSFIANIFLLCNICVVDMWNGVRWSPCWNPQFNIITQYQGKKQTPAIQSEEWGIFGQVLLNWLYILYIIFIKVVTPAPLLCWYFLADLRNFLLIIPPWHLFGFHKHSQTKYTDTHKTQVCSSYFTLLTLTE